MPTTHRCSCISSAVPGYRGGQRASCLPPMDVPVLSALSLQEPRWALRECCPHRLRESTRLTSVKLGFEPSTIYCIMSPGLCSQLYPQLLLSWYWFLTGSHGPGEGRYQGLKVKEDPEFLSSFPHARGFSGSPWPQGSLS